MLQTFRQALQSWRGAKGVAALAAIALAVGIGSTTAIYTVVNGVMFRSLPYAGGDRFVALYGTTFNEPNRRSSHRPKDLLEYQQRTRSFDVFGWFQPVSFNLMSAGGPQHVNGAAVTSSLALNLGVSPALGQWFRDDTGVVLSNALWRRLGSDPNIVSKPLILNDRSYTVTGVMPARFRLPLPGPGVENVQNDVWVFLDPMAGRDVGASFCYGRLKPGVTMAQAEDDVRRVAAEIAQLGPESHRSYTARLDDLRESVISGIRPTLLLLFAAAALLLLITCANVAGLLLARSVARARDTAIRVALGAGQWRLALHFFVEGLLVSLAGALAGVLLSLALVRIVLSIASAYVPRADEIAIDWRVFAFALGAAGLAAALTSLAPLWQAMRTSPNDVLNSGVRASASARSRRLSQWLVITEIALAFTLLTVGAVLIAHLRNLARTSPGFDPDNLLTFRLTPPAAVSASEETHLSYQARMTAALETIAGVSGVGLVNQLPLDGCCLSTTIYPEGRPVDRGAASRTSFLTVNPAYFRTVGVPLRRGRFLTEQDVSEDLLFVVINQAAANRDWPREDPVGVFGRFGVADGSRFQVIGVVGDTRNDRLGASPVPEVYLLSSVVPVDPLRFIVRSALPAETLVTEVRRAVQSVDPTQSVHDVATMHEIARESLTLERVSSLMTTFFALAALLLAALGIYGVVSYSVRQRTIEIGTRMALGAVKQDILRLVVGGGLRMAAYGIALGGLAVAAAVWVLVRNLGIHDIGLSSFAYSTAGVAAIAGLASFYPAWRSTRLSPMVAIRNEPGSGWQSARQTFQRAMKGLSQALSATESAPAVSERALLNTFVDAARRAESPSDALRMAMETLCSSLGAESGILLEQASEKIYRRTATAEASAPKALPAPGLLLNRLSHYSAPLPLTAGDLDTWEHWASVNRPQYLPEIAFLKESAIRLAAPLQTSRGIVGVLLLGQPAGRTEYSPAEKEVVRHCAQQLTLMIENARLTDRVVEQEKLRRDLALAAEVQRRLLPEQPPQSSIAALAAVTLPARSVGGDYYDFIDVSDHRLGIAVADIAGKGVAAALLMSVVQASLRFITAEEGVSLPQVAERMNRALHRSTGSNGYATFFYAQIDERNRQLRYVNAGHNPPYLLRSNESDRTSPTESREHSAAHIQELSTGGTVLGLFPQVSYEEATIDLKPGDTLVAFTDGVTEALNPQGEEFGEERLKGLLQEVVDLKVDEIASRILQQLRGWIEGAVQHDDLTFVVMKVN
jgi:predicted permease